MVKNQREKLWAAPVTQLRKVLLVVKRSSYRRYLGISVKKWLASFVFWLGSSWHQEQIGNGKLREGGEIGVL